MFLIPQQIPWTQQPQVVAPLHSNVIAAGLASVGFGVDLASSSPVTAVSGSRVVTPGGVAVNAPLATITLRRGVKNGYTLIAVITGGTITSENWIGADIATRWWQFRSYGGAAVQFIPFDTGGSPYFPTASAPPTASTYVVIATVGNGSAQAWSGAIGGTALSDGAVTLASPRLITAGEQIFLGSRDGNNNTLSSGCLGYAVLDGGIDNAAAQRIIENPWQIFAPQTQELFIPNITGGGPANITGTLSSTLDPVTTTIQGSLGHISTFSVSLDTVSVVSSGVLNHIGTSTSILDDVVVTFSGAVDTAGSVSGTMAFTLDSIAFSSTGNLNHSTTINFTLDDIFVSLSGTVAGTPENIDGTVSIVLDGIGFTSSGNSGTLTLTEDDINAIMTAIINNPKTLTIPKFLGLK